MVIALIKHLAGINPLPIHFKAHDMQTAGHNLVMISQDDMPVFYMNQRYLTVSIPMKPRPAAAAARRRAKPSAKKAK